MANHKSSKKRAKQTIVKNARNSFFKTKLKNTIKAVMSSVEAKDITKAQEAFLKANKFIHHCVSKGILKKNTAARRVSMLHLKIKALNATSAIK
jgi:small subunit ribosomal protein S20